MSDDDEVNGGSVRAVVFDLDGVIREWDVGQAWAIEFRCGIPVGSIREAVLAVDDGPGHDVVTGVITDEEWREVIASRMEATWGGAARRAVTEWARRSGDVKADVHSYAQELRRDFAVSVLTNGTSRVRRDLEFLGLADSFDVVFNSSEIGVAKPDRGIYEYVTDRLDIAPGQWLFVDDDRVNVRGAEACGVRAHLFEGLEDLRSWIDAERG